jgi:hypothetical protein
MDREDSLRCESRIMLHKCFSCPMKEIEGPLARQGQGTLVRKGKLVTQGILVKQGYLVSLEDGQINLDLIKMEIKVYMFI